MMLDNAKKLSSKGLLREYRKTQSICWEPLKKTFKNPNGLHFDQINNYLIVTDAQLQEGSVYTEPPAVTMIVGDEYGSHDSSDFLVEPDAIQESFSSPLYKVRYIDSQYRNST